MLLPIMSELKEFIDIFFTSGKPGSYIQKTALAASLYKAFYKNQSSTICFDLIPSLILSNAKFKCSWLTWVFLLSTALYAALLTKFLISAGENPTVNRAIAGKSMV